MTWLVAAVALVSLAMPVHALQVGDPAPDVAAPSTGGTTVNIRDFKGSWLVVYFYPKSFTPGCTKQSCSLRDGYADIQALGATILGVSFDDLEAQKKFKAEHKLPFELLADEKKDVAKAFDAIGLGGFMAQRETFIINPDGVVAAILQDIAVGSHDQQVLDALKRLQSAPAPGS